MADIALGVVGAAIGGTFGGVQGALLGWSAGTLVGGALWPPKQQAQQVGKLDDVARRVVGSAYGTVIPQCWGKIAVGGNIIWATELEEHVSRKREGGKGGGKRTTNSYTYTADFAVYFCQGERRIRRIWLEDVLVWDSGAPVGNYTIRIYDGDEAQTVDPRIEEVEGTGNAPAYRGMCYAVFENILLSTWGNRVPAAIRAEVDDVDGNPVLVSDVLGDLLDQVGITSAYRQLTGGHSGDTVRGFTLGNRVPCRDAVEPLLMAFASTFQESDGLLKLVALDASVQGTISASDLGSVVWDSKDSNHAVPTLTGRLLDDLDLPAHADLNYIGEAFRGYERSTASRERFSLQDLQEKLSIDVPLVLSEEEAANLVTRLLYEQWKHGEQFTFTLPPRSGLKLCAGDLWYLPVGADTPTVRVTRVDMALPLGVVECEAVLYEPAVVTQNASGAGLGGVNDSISTVADTTLIAWSSNNLQDADANQVGVYVVANGAIVGSWPGATLYLSRDGGTTYSVLDELADPGSYGETDSTLAAPPTHVGTAIWDDVSTVDVDLTNGNAPETKTDSEVLAGQNGVWFETGEVIQFAIATNLGGGVYRLSRLLRGRQGTEPFWGSHTTGEQVVFLEAGAIKHEALSDDTINATIKLKAVTAGQELGDATDVDVTVTGYEWKPWAGSDGRGERDTPSTDDWTITWKRRTRSGGVWADGGDVADLDAEFGYELEVFTDGTYTTVARTFTGLTSASQVYLAADQTSDFGGPQSTLYLRAFQLGRYGRGWPYDFTVTRP